MIDKEILDAVLPLPTLDELKEQKVEELKDEGFVISNFHSGGVFYTMLMIVLRIKVEVFELLRVVLNSSEAANVPALGKGLPPPDAPPCAMTVEATRCPSLTICGHTPHTISPHLG